MIYAAIVFLPLAGALIAGLFGRVIGDRPSELITTLFLMIAAVLSWVVFVQVGFAHVPAGEHGHAASAIKVPLMRWITSGDLDVSWGLRVDTLTAVMLVVVTTVSASSISTRSATCTRTTAVRVSSLISRCSRSPCSCW